MEEGEHLYIVTERVCSVSIVAKIATSQLEAEKPGGGIATLHHEIVSREAHAELAPVA